MHQNNSSRKSLARLSVCSGSLGLPLSSKLSCTLGTGNMAGMVQAFIFHRENWIEVMTCDPPNGPAETVEIATGL